jgi:hypothetical protein
MTLVTADQNLIGLANLAVLPDLQSLLIERIAPKRPQKGGNAKFLLTTCTV